jgi:hypothetical protein
MATVLSKMSGFGMKSRTLSRSSCQRPGPKGEDSQESSTQGQMDSDLGGDESCIGSCPWRDWIVLMPDMTDALRPNELFALRWRSFDDVSTLSITETV